MNIRPAKVSDHRFLKDLHHAVYRAVVTRQFGCWNEAEQDVWFKKGLSEAEYHIVECDDLPIAAVGLRNAPDHISLVELQVLPEYQNKGVGTQLLLRELERGANLGLPVRLQVLRESRARQLYERHRFVAFGETATHILMIWRPAQKDEHVAERVSAPAASSESIRPPVLPEPVDDIEFIDLGPLIDGDLELRLVRTTPADHVRGFAPVYGFEMMKQGLDVIMGHINLRVGHTMNIELYRGHIGFRVHEPFRGNRLALRSCRLLAGLARHHCLLPVWLTCDEGNVPSQKTIEALGATFVEVRTMPSDFPYIDYYAPEARVKRRYRWMPHTSSTL